LVQEEHIRKGPKTPGPLLSFFGERRASPKTEIKENQGLQQTDKKQKWQKMEEERKTKPYGSRHTEPKDRSGPVS